MRFEWDTRKAARNLKRRRISFAEASTVFYDPLAKTIAKVRLKVLSKLGVKGYQPYERLGLWLRRELRTMVESILLDDRCLERGVFNPETVRAAVTNHGNNRRHSTSLAFVPTHQATCYQFACKARYRACG